MLYATVFNFSLLQLYLYYFLSDLFVIFFI